MSWWDLAAGVRKQTCSADISKISRSALCVSNIPVYQMVIFANAARKVPVDAAYGEGEPCCICFGAEDEAADF